MAIATLNNIEKTFGPRTIFDKLSFTIDRGERVGLIGDNGSGKTTLFRVLVGQMPVDAGSVAIAKGVKLGHLSQDPVFDPANTVLDEAELAFADLHSLSHRLRELEHDMAALTGEALDRILKAYQDAQHQFELAGGYAWRHRLEETLLGVGLDRQIWEQNVTTLSGGQRSRLGLAKLLVADNELLLLDEPTNHLDLAAIAWLENYLASFSGAMIIISHDRYLLDRLATRMVWLTQARLKSYPGNYSAFTRQRQVQELSQQRAYEQQQADIQKQAEFIRRFGAGQRAREAKGRQKRLQRLLRSDELVQAVGTNKQIRVALNVDQRAGDRVLSVRELSKSYDGKKLWADVALEIKRGERVGIVGPNGSGKTTLLEVLLGRRDADAGSVRWGANLSLGYYDQQLHDFDLENSVADEVRGDRRITDQDLRSILGMMLFRDEQIERPIRQLSGGERARVAIAQLLLDRPNVLLMDEPTNHLDIQSSEAVESALRDFDGTILCVSHDRYFLDRVVSRLLVLQPPVIVQFDGNFTAWSKHAAPKRLAPPPKLQKPQKPQPPAQAKKKSQNAFARPFGRLTLDQLEKQITQTELALAECQSSFADPAISRAADASRKLNEQYQTLQRKLADLEAEYFARSA